MCQSISHCYLSPSFSTLSASCSPKPICYYWRYKYLKAGQKEEEVNNALCGAICSCRIRGLTQNKLQSLFMWNGTKEKKNYVPQCSNGSLLCFDSFWATTAERNKQYQSLVILIFDSRINLFLFMGVLYDLLSGKYLQERRNFFF